LLNDLVVIFKYHQREKPHCGDQQCGKGEKI
jgi:hypothetical protein